MTTTIATRKDLTPEIEERIVSTALDWAGTGPIDWDDMLDRIERYCDLELPGQIDDPVIQRIQNKVRAARREAAS